ncbi:MAG: ABC transporter substrate-binding protein [Caldisericia bacterium]|nr:ABC transporter substrate-binding protein [Caldisericia bacterium]
MKKWIVSCFILCFCGTILQGCTMKKASDSLTKVKVLLDWVPNTNHTGLYVALEEGFYEEYGLYVEIIQASEGGTSQLIGAKQATFGISYQEEVTFAKEKGIPVQAIATILQHNTSGFASPASKNIKSPKDFEYKTYGGWGSPVEIATLKALMEKYDADFETLDIATIGAVDFLTATQNVVDFAWIYYGWDGVAAELKNIDLHFIDLGKEHESLDFYTPVIIVNEDTIVSNPDLISTFLEATYKGYAFCIENPEKAASILMKYTPESDPEMILASQKWVDDYYIDPPTPWGYMQKDRWDLYTKWLFDNQLIDTMIDSDDMYTNEFLP